MPLSIPAVQGALREEGLDGWLLYDFHGSNPIARRLTGLDTGGKMTTREDAEAAGHPLAGHIVMRDEVRAFQLAGEVILTQSDVRALQFAKGAISTGIETAMRALDLKAEDLDEVMLAGSFGSFKPTMFPHRAPPQLTMATLAPCAQSSHA